MNNPDTTVRLSYLESSARARLLGLLDPGSFHEFLPPQARLISPHLAQLDAPVSFDDGVAIGQGTLRGRRVAIASQEGGFMGGAVGEVHGAKLVGLLQRAVADRVEAVLLLLDTGGVRLHEANAGLIAVSEVMRAILDTRAAGIPVLVLIGGSNGCFGGMGIAACCANVVIMSEEGRLALSGPEVIETANGVEEFDSRDRALVWRTTGGKHRYLMGDCQHIVADLVSAFRDAALKEIVDLAASNAAPIELTLESLEAEQTMLTRRLQRHGAASEPLDIWRVIGITAPQALPLLDADAFAKVVDAQRKGDA
jgi:malonate decarboxylase beta subunit